MNHHTATPGTGQDTAAAAHGGHEFDPDHDCEFCSPEPVTIPPPSTHRDATPPPGAAPEQATRPADHDGA